MKNNITLKASGNTDIAENGEVFYTVDGGMQNPFNCGENCVISLEKGNYKIKMFFKRLGAKCGNAAVDIAVNSDERLVLTYIVPELISQDGKIEVETIKPEPKPEPEPEPQPEPQPEPKPEHVPIDWNFPTGSTAVKKRKSRVTAGVLGILLGGWGIHKFYLGKTGMGILYILFCWTYIPAIAGFIEGISYLCQSDEKFWSKYC